MHKMKALSAVVLVIISLVLTSCIARTISMQEQHKSAEKLSENLPGDFIIVDPRDIYSGKVLSILSSTKTATS